MTKREIEKLGMVAGAEDAADFYHRTIQEVAEKAARDAYEDDTDELSDEEQAAEVSRRLLATLAPSQLGWDEGARNAGANTIDRVFGTKNIERYYAAYNRGAEARIRELTV